MSTQNTGGDQQAKVTQIRCHCQECGREWVIPEPEILRVPCTRCINPSVLTVPVVQRTPAACLTSASTDDTLSG